MNRVSALRLPLRVAWLTCPDADTAAQHSWHATSESGHAFKPGRPARAGARPLDGRRAEREAAQQRPQRARHAREAPPHGRAAARACYRLVRAATLACAVSTRLWVKQAHAWYVLRRARALSVRGSAACGAARPGAGFRRAQVRWLKPPHALQSAALLGSRTSAFSFQPTAFSLPPSAYCLQSTAYRRQPPASTRLKPGAAGEGARARAPVQLADQGGALLYPVQLDAGHACQRRARSGRRRGVTAWCRADGAPAPAAAPGSQAPAACTRRERSQASLVSQQICARAARL